VHIVHPVVKGADYTIMQALYDAYPDQRQALYGYTEGHSHKASRWPLAASLSIYRHPILEPKQFPPHSLVSRSR
jgi:hypothetical protein